MLIKVKLLTLILVLGLIGLFNSANATTEDSDNDGYSNLCEKLHKTDPNDAESKPLSNITINVPSDVDSIQEAINAAIDGDTIVVSQGKYQGNINFKCKSITLTSTAPLNSEVVSKTIIEGTEKGSVVTIDSNSILKGFTITSKDLDCRGIYVKNVSPKIENCTIIDNETTGYGGGIYISTTSSRAQITNCIITRNKDKSDTGKSAQISGGTPQISQSWINGQGLVNTTENINTESITQPSVPNTETTPSTEPPPTEAQSPTTASDTVVIEPPTTDTELTSIEPPTIAQQSEGSSDTVIQNSENSIEDSPVMPLSGSTIWYVDDDASDTGDGTSWDNAFKYLQDALSDTRIIAGDELWVAQGTYKPDQGGDTPLDRTATFRLINGVTVKGGYAGIGEPDPNARNIANYQTILSGDLNGDDIRDSQLTNYGDNSYHVVTSINTDTTTILDGFTIIGGNANVEQFFRYAGGGMHNNNGSTTVTNCTFSYNWAINGGGVYNLDTIGNSSPKFTNCIFSNNRARQWGGGVFNWGVITPEFTNCVFTMNSVDSTPFYGYGGGGGISNWGSDAKIINCIFDRNSASSYGGGIDNNTSNPTITNCTFYGNSTTHGDGIYNNFSDPIITNCILWNNTEEIYNEVYDGNEWISNPVVTYCDIQGGYTGEGNINSDPLFLNASNPAGADGIFFTIDDGLRIRINSPCIDSANGDIAPLTDITGLGRIDIANIPNTGTGTPNYVDIGACESGHDFDSDGMPDEWESFYGLNPSNPDDANQDADSDEVSNLWEYIYNTNPTNSDTDGDGLSDGYEIYAYHTDPNNPDTDGDGVNDGTEANQGSDPADPSDNGQPPTPEELLSLLEAAYNAGDWEEIALNADKLAKQGSAAIPQLTAVLQDEGKDPDFREIIAEILEQIGDPNAAGPLITILEDVNQDTYIRAEAAYTLGTTGNEIALTPLLNALNNSDIDIKSSAALGLGLLGREEAITPLITLLENTEEPAIVRIRSGQALSTLKTLLALNTFINILQNDGDETMRGRSALWLGSLEHTDAVPPLIEAVNEDSPYVADNAATALGMLKDPSAVDALINALDKGGLLRINSAEALAQIGDLRATLPIANAIENEQDSWGKQKLKEAYKTLTGVEYQP